VWLSKAEKGSKVGPPVGGCRSGSLNCLQGSAGRWPRGWMVGWKETDGMEMMDRVSKRTVGKTARTAHERFPSRFD